MPIKSDREYRSIPVFNIEKRDEGEAPSFFVEGYASTFDTYLLFEDPDGTKYQEHIDPHAFDNCDMSDVVFQRDHSGPVYARTSNGSIKVSIDGHGLHQRADLGRTSGARQMFEDIQAGMYTQMSFAFTVDRSSIEYDRQNNTFTRQILSVRKLYDVSAVSFPANPYTDIGVSARSLFDGAIEEQAEERRRVELELAKAKYLYQEAE